LLATSVQFQVVVSSTFNLESKMLVGYPEYLYQLTLRLNLVAHELVMIQFDRYVSLAFQTPKELYLFPKSIQHTYVSVPYC